MLSTLYAVAMAFVTLGAAQTVVTSTSALAPMASSVITDPGAVTATSGLITNTFSIPSAMQTSYPIDPSVINSTIKASWCQAQENACFSICNDNPKTSNCDPVTLDYSCQCVGNTPNLAQFNNTIPFFECQTYQNNCILATNNAQQQRQCLAIQCGGKNPDNFVAGDSSSMTSGATGTAPTSGAGSASPTDGPNAGSMLHAAENLGLGLFAVGVAVFGFAL